MPTRSLLRPHKPLPDDQSPVRAFSSRHFLKLIEETGEVGFWSADLRRERVEASVGLFRILGLDPTGDLTFGLLLDMIHPDDRAAHGDQIAVLRGGQAIDREFRVIRPDRTQRWIRHRAEVVLGPEGQPSHGMGALFDVTARHDAIRAIEQRHDRFNALLSATAAAFWINGPDGEPLEMPQWAALTGQSHAQVLGEGWLDAVHPEDRARTAAAWMTAVTHIAPYNTDYRILCADGVYRWFNARGVPILNRDGTVREWVGVCLNVPGQNRYGTAPTKPEADRAVLTAAQIRGARGMLGLSKEELAKRARVSVSTVVRLEDEATTVQSRPDTVQAVRRVLEAAGIAFTFEPGERPGLRQP